MTEHAEEAQRPLKKRIVNKIGMEFILVPGGEFIMGTDDVVPEPSDLAAVTAVVTEMEKKENFTRYDFAPKHQVSIKPFYMARHPVTQAHWARVMGNNKASFKDGWDFPMETVSWYDALEFIRRLNELMNTDAHRLPTEAEWEFCCRAGSAGDYSFDGPVSRLGLHAWFSGNTRWRPRAVGQKKANKFGLFDMHGLVWEWTSSLERSYPYQGEDGREDLKSPGQRVVRGGSWLTTEYMCRCGFREFHLPTHRDHDIGFRLAVS